MCPCDALSSLFGAPRDPLWEQGILPPHCLFSRALLITSRNQFLACCLIMYKLELPCVAPLDPCLCFHSLPISQPQEPRSHPMDLLLTQQEKGPGVTPISRAPEPIHFLCIPGKRRRNILCTLGLGMGSRAVPCKPPLKLGAMLCAWLCKVPFGHSVAEMTLPCPL